MLFQSPEQPFSIKIQLPTGGTLIASPDPDQHLSSDCSRIINFLGQVASYLASTECLLRMLQVMHPLIDVVKSLPPSPKLAAVVPRFLKAAEGLTPCLNAVTGAGVLPFVRDLLCLTIRALNCITDQMKTLLALMNGLAQQLDAAQASGNAELVALLQEEQNKARIAGANLIASLDPIRAVLDLSGAMFEMAGVNPLHFPAFNPQSDPESLTQLAGSLQGFASSLQIVVDTMGGCEG